MTRERLSQFDDLIHELREEQERLAREIRHAARLEEQFGVYNLFGASDRICDARRAVIERTARYEDEIIDIRRWVETVRDSMTRRALKLRYLDGLSWSDVARRMGYADESGPRKLVERLLSGETGA